MALLASATACNREDRSPLNCRYTAAMQYGLRVDGAFQGAFTAIEAPSGNSGTLILKNGLIPKNDSLASWVTALKKIDVLNLSGGRVAGVQSSYEASLSDTLQGARSQDDEHCMVVTELHVLVGDDARQQAQAMGAQMDAGMDGGVPDGGVPGQRR
jgi:hypothetical protein